MTKSRFEDPTGIALLGLLGIVWGTTFPVVRWGIDAGANPFAMVVVDFGIAALLTASVAAVRRSPRPSVRDLAISMAVGGLLIGGTNLTLFWGEQFSTGGAAAIVYAAAPLVSTVAALGLGVRAGLSRWQSSALAIGLAGVVVLALTTSGTSVLHNLWAIAAFALGAACQGSGAVLLAWVRPSGEGPWGLSFQFLGASATALVLWPLLPYPFSLPLRIPVVGAIAFVALGTGTAGYLVYFELIRRSGPVRANVVTYVNPVVALLTGVLIFHEPFKLIELVGLAIILVALVFLERE